jgi:hypothetical protein
MQCKEGYPARRKLKRRTTVLLDLANQTLACLIYPCSEGALLE